MFNRRNTLGPTVVGLDLGSSSLKVAYVQDGIPLLMEEQPLPRGAIERGRILDVGAVETALRELWKRAGVPLSELRFVFANQSTLIRAWELVDPGSERDLQRAIDTNASIILDPFNPDTAVLDAHEVGRDGQGNLRLLLAAAEREDVVAYQQALRSAKLRQTGCEPAAVAQLHAYAVDPEAPTAIVSVGAELTLVAVAHGSAIQYLRVVPLGGNDFTEAMRAVEGAGDFAAREALKRRIGIDPVDVDPVLDARIVRDAQTAMIGAAERLIQEVGLSLDHYARLPGSPRIEVGLLGGGGARLLGLRSLFDEYGQPAGVPEAASWASGVPDVDLFGAALGASLDKTFDLSPRDSGRRGKKAKRPKTSETKPAKGAEDRAARRRGDSERRSPYRLVAVLAILSLAALGASWQYFERGTVQQQQRDRDLRRQLIEDKEAQSDSRLQASADFIARNQLARELINDREARGRIASEAVAAARAARVSLTQVSVGGADNPLVLGGTATDSAYARMVERLRSQVGEINELDRTDTSFRIGLTPRGGKRP